MERKMFTSVPIILFFIIGSQSAVLVKHDDDVMEQGLYHRNDKVVILTHDNLERRIYGQEKAWLVQFYNSHCGHCRNLAPKFKMFAADVAAWSGVVRVGVVDCLEDNNSIDCRNFEVMAYPSLRYFHENYAKGNENLGEQIEVGRKPEQTIGNNLLAKLIEEQKRGRLLHAPPLVPLSYSTLTEAMAGVAASAKYTFMIFENVNSTIGAKVLLDTSEYQNIAARLVLSSSNLANLLDITRFPALVAVRNDLQVTHLTPKVSDRDSLVHAINLFLESKNMPIPKINHTTEFPNRISNDVSDDNGQDEVRLDDLETALDKTLRQEISRYKITSGESLKALRQFVSVLIDYFPFRANGKAFMLELKNKIASQESIPGEQIQKWVTELMNRHKPVFATPLKYVKCLGSEVWYRGHTCGLWMMFHSLTVSAARARGGSGPDVLSAMHGYVKHFFACTECSEHFQAMALKNNITLVRDNSGAVLWLWIAHNEVNLRLAGDSTEDPKFPKVQFPLAERCPECRLSNGAWKLDSVYRYLLNMYSTDTLRPERHSSDAEAQLSPMDFVITVTVYILSLLIIILACRLLFVRTGRFVANGRLYRRHLNVN